MLHVPSEDMSHCCRRMFDRAAQANTLDKLQRIDCQKCGCEYHKVFVDDGSIAHWVYTSTIAIFHL